jgi:uncharacterized Zn finger protein
MICPYCSTDKKKVHMVEAVTKTDKHVVWLCSCGRVHDKKRRVLWRFRHIEPLRPKKAAICRT